MKKPWLAFILNFILPGVGLAYLQQWRWALVNFVVVQAILLWLIVAAPDKSITEHIHYIVLGLAALSAGAAHAMALRTNAQGRTPGARHEQMAKSKNGH